MACQLLASNMSFNLSGSLAWTRYRSSRKPRDVKRSHSNLSAAHRKSTHSHNYYNLPGMQPRRHGGSMVGLAPQTKYQAPQIVIWNTINH